MVIFIIKIKITMLWVVKKQIWHNISFCFCMITHFNFYLGRVKCYNNSTLYFMLELRDKFWDKPPTL